MKKAVSPLISAILVLVFTVSISTVILNWVTDYTKTTTDDATESATGPKGITYCANSNLEISNVKIMDKKLIENTSISSGTTNDFNLTSIAGTPTITFTGRSSSVPLLEDFLTEDNISSKTNITVTGGIAKLAYATWWNSNWQYSMPISLTNNNDTQNLQANYTTTTTFNLTNCANAGKCQRNASDVRVIWNNGTEENEIDRIIEPSSALDFDGTNDYVDVKDDNSLDLTSKGSIVVWIYPKDVTNNVIVDKIYYVSPNAYGYALRINSGNLQAYVGDGGSAESITGVLSVSTNQWSLVTYIWNSTGQYLYLNNTFDKTETITGAASANTYNIRFGQQTDTDFFGDTYFNGTIDEVAIFNRTLNSTEISNLYNNGVGRPISSDWFNTTGLVGLWHMDEKIGKGITDSSGNNNDGELGDGTTANMPKWTQGKITEEGEYAQGYDFDGTGDYIRVENIDSIDSVTEYSFTAWVNVEDSVFISYYDGTWSWGNIVFYSTLSAIANGYVAVGVGASGSVNVDQTDGGFGTGWVHIAVTAKDNDYLRLYIGGIEQNNASIAGILHEETNSYLLLGSYNFGPFTTGTYDDVAIFNRTLNAIEISTLYNNGNGLEITDNNFNTTGLVGYWKLDGNTLDSSDNRNDGTPKGDVQATFGKVLKTRNNTVRFKVQENISSSTTDQNYSIYYGNTQSGTPPTDVSDVFLNTGLVAYWSLDGHAMDIVSGNDGQLINEPQTVPGFEGDGLNFDGTDDYFTVLNSTDLNIAETITISAWIDISGYSSGVNRLACSGTTYTNAVDDNACNSACINAGYTSGTLICYGGGCAASCNSATTYTCFGQQYNSIISCAGPGAYKLNYCDCSPARATVLKKGKIMDETSSAYSLDVSSGTIWGTINNNRISASISSQSWMYIVLTYDKNAGSNQQKLYVDGILKSQGTLASSININSNNLILGNGGDITQSSPTTNIERFFNGTIDEVRIYNRSLSTAEIQQLYISTAPSTQTQSETAEQSSTTGVIYSENLTSNPTSISWTGTKLENITMYISEDNATWGSSITTPYTIPETWNSLYYKAIFDYDTTSPELDTITVNKGGVPTTNPKASINNNPNITHTGTLNLGQTETINIDSDNFTVGENNVTIYTDSGEVDYNININDLTAVITNTGMNNVTVKQVVAFKIDGSNCIYSNSNKTFDVGGLFSVSGCSITCNDFLSLKAYTDCTGVSAEHTTTPIGC